jgi:hypothetical protein
MNQNKTEPKPPSVEEPREEGLDVTPCSASWLMIETAPKDGTQILITDGEQIEVGHWGTVPCTISARCGWRYGPGDIYSGYDEMETPTHWMPLPSPPNA